MQEKREKKHYFSDFQLMAQLNNGGWRQVKSVKLSRTACLAIATNADSKKPIVKVAREMMYNLDAIIAVGYRVNSYEATKFRIWAREVLKEYIVKGFVMDDERLKGKNPFGADYFEELLDRIREIRLSERRYYPLLRRNGTLPLPPT